MNLELISKYFILFIIYSFAGWVMETLWVSWCNRRLVDRGFLIGPYCPIYGFGALLIVLLLNKLAFSPILVFLMTVFVCGALEYFASWIMEKIFKARWWDYSNVKFNLNGRICLKNLIAFGIMGLAVIYVINPNLETWIKYFINKEQLMLLAFVLWTIFIMDFVISTIVVYGFRRVTEKVNEERIGDNTEQITKMVRKLLSEKSFFHRRFINAYPKLEAIKTKMKEIKTKIEDVTNDAKDAVLEKVNDAKDIVVERTENIRNTIEQNTKKAKVKFSLETEHLRKSFKGKIRKDVNK